MTLRLSRSFYYWYFWCVWITSIQKQICQPFLKCLLQFMCEERFLWERNLDLLHHLQKQFKDCNVYLCVHIRVHVYLTYIADSWSKRLWKRMMLIANDLHRSVEICTANLHASSSFLFGDPLCHSPLHPFLRSALLLPKAALSSASHVLCQIDRLPFT